MPDPSPSSTPRRASKRRRIDQSIEHSRSPSASETSTRTPPTSCSPVPSSAATSQPPTLKRFLTWCAKRGVSISPDLELRYTGDAVSWSISCHASSLIPADTVIATIPKSAVLSRKTSALAPHLTGKYLSESHETVGLELALCLLYERCLGAQSAFAPFIAILPRLPVALPLLRDPEPDAASHWRWLTGTEADRVDHRAAYAHLASTTAEWRYDHDYGMSKHKALDYFHEIGIPVLKRSGLFDKTQRQHLDGLEGAFLTAYTHVSSRDFIVDAYHGVGMVPVADLFNHAETHTVQFESDQDVCERCGVALLTGHEQEDCEAGAEDEDTGSEQDEREEEEAESESDSDESPEETHAVIDGDVHSGYASAVASANKNNDGVDDEAEESDREMEKADEEKGKAEEGSEEGSENESGEEAEEEEEYVDTLDMHTLSAHVPASELYNTYGPLTNALLLTRYGFCLDTETDWERYTFDLRFPVERAQFLAAFISSPLHSASQSQWEQTFARVLERIIAHFPTSLVETKEDPDEDQEAEDPGLGVEAKALDRLHRLDTLSRSSWAGETFSSLFNSHSLLADAALDSDVVDRDAIHPLFISGTGRISWALFALVLLVHYAHAHPSSRADLATVLADAKQSDELTQASLRTLHAVCTARLDGLHITHHLPEALDRLAATDGPYIEKACIQHAYQEHAALRAALGSLDDLILPF